jgi:hypothetical protein
MRTIISLFVILLLSFTATAQKKTILLAGNIYFQQDKNRSYGNDNSSSNFGFTPLIGYGFSDNWTAGVALGYEKYKSNYKSHTYSAGPFARYTHQISEIFSVFGQLSGTFYKRTYSADPDYHGLDINLIPAIELNIKKGFAVNLNIGGVYYEYTKVDGVPNSSSRLVLNFGSGVTIGVSKRF